MPTIKQNEILDFMRRYQEDHQALNCPTLKEIAVGVGLNTRAAAQWHVKRLEALGHVERLPNVGYRKYHALPSGCHREPNPESPSPGDKAGHVHTKADPGLRETRT